MTRDQQAREDLLIEVREKMAKAGSERVRRLLRDIQSLPARTEEQANTLH